MQLGRKSEKLERWSGRSSNWNVSNGMDAPGQSGIECARVESARPTTMNEGSVQNETTTIGIDLAKNVLQVHGVDEQGKVALQKQ